MDCLENEAMLKELINHCKIAGQEYKARTDRMKQLFARLYINHESSQKLNDLVSKLSSLQEQYNLKELNEHSLLLAHADKSKKSSDMKYLLKQQEVHLKAYLKLEKMLVDLLGNIERELNVDNANLSVDEAGISSKMAKIKMYKNELDKLNEKSVAVADFNLANIAKEVKALEALRSENAALKQELSCYGGLKPDLEEAARQLAQVKLEYEQLTSACHK